MTVSQFLRLIICLFVGLILMISIHMCSGGGMHSLSALL